MKLNQKLKKSLLLMSEGILLVDKPKGITSFQLVRVLRKKLNVQKIGHAGTLDPMATGLMVMLIGRRYTKLSDSFLTCDKEYNADITLGYATDSYDAEGSETHRSETIPTLEEINTALQAFQGSSEQTPPMFSAKKVNGEKLYDLARKGITIERKQVTVRMEITLLSYNYPHLSLNVRCSKGTYIRSLSHDLGEKLGSYATLTGLRRLASGDFRIDNSIDGQKLMEGTQEVVCHLMPTLDLLPERSPETTPES